MHINNCNTGEVESCCIRIKNTRVAIKTISNIKSLKIYSGEEWELWILNKEVAVEPEKKKH